jgi:hypothetical protein
MSDDRIRAAVRSENELAMTDAAFDGLRIAMVNELIGTNYDEADKREHLYHGLRALTDVRDALKAMVKAGSDAKAYEEAAALIAKGAQA